MVHVALCLVVVDFVVINGSNRYTVLHLFCFFDDVKVVLYFDLSILFKKNFTESAETLAQ